MEAVERKCKRCGKSSSILICASCKRDLDDERYLDEGSVANVNEQLDRGVCGEYAELNEGDEYHE